MARFSFERLLFRALCNRHQTTRFKQCSPHFRVYTFGLMTERNCTFCNIYDGKEAATILYKDEDVVIFTDIRPASKHHYLVVPREHLLNAKQLTKEHIPLVENLLKHGKRILQEKGADVEDSRFGFHWPPFNSISHLHLHAISPASQMSFLSKMIFQEGSLWFVKPQYVLQRLAKL